MISLQPHETCRVASATQNGKTESFLWDGLALIHRGETGYINEPYATGGNPLLSSKGDVMFNVEGDRYVRTLPGTGNIFLRTSETWNFVPNQNDSIWDALKKGN